MKNEDGILEAAYELNLNDNKYILLVALILLLWLFKCSNYWKNKQLANIFFV